MPADSSFTETLLELAHPVEEPAGEELRAWASRVSNTLRPHTGSILATRIYTRTALASALPANARFVTDVLIESKQWDLARILAETAERDAKKNWQKRKLASLKEHVATAEGFGVRPWHAITLDPQGVSEEGGAPQSVSAWLRSWIPRLEESPLGLLPDPLLVRCTAGLAAADLGDLLRQLSHLPVAPVLLFESAEEVAGIQSSLLESGLDWGWARQPLTVMATAPAGGYTLVGFLGHPLLDVGAVQGFLDIESEQLPGLALVASALWLLQTPALSKKWDFVIAALHRESGDLFPRSSRRRFAEVVSRFLWEGRRRSTQGQELAGLLLHHGYYEEALGLLEAVPPAFEGAYFDRRMVRALYGTGRFDQLVSQRWDSLESSLEIRQLAEARAAQELISQAEKLGLTPAPEAADAVPGKVVTFLHASQPVQNGGYANRAHQILKGIASHGFQVLAYTRPGFPENGPTLAPGQVVEADYDGVSYRRIGVEHPRRSGEYQYMRECLRWYREILEREKPSVVHLRSTYVSALPGLIAAHSLGIPVVYEVSGMWELVYASKDSARMESLRARTVVLENAVLRHADAVTTLTEAMSTIVQERCDLPRRPTVLPNAVDVERFTDRERDDQVAAELGWPAESPVIGYIGSFVDYEGLDDLIDACAILKSRGVDFRTLMIGDGAEYSAVVGQAEERGLTDRVHFMGRVAHEEVDRLYSAIDICVYPRKLTMATAAVSPLKPFEAMALRKTVLVSDVPALSEIAGDSQRAFIFPHSNAEALADALEGVLRHPERAAPLTEEARAWVEAERSWDFVGTQFASILTRTALKEQSHD